MTADLSRITPLRNTDHIVNQTPTIVSIVPNDDDYAHLVVDPIASIDEAYDYAELCALIRAALDKKEMMQWAIGDLLLATRTVYAEQTMSGLAAAVGVSPSSLYSWRDMAAFYPEHVRAYYQAKELYFSHLRLAMSLGGLDEAREFLDLCHLSGWSVGAAALELKRLKGAYVPPMPRYVTCTFHREGDRLYIDGLDLDGIVIGEGVKYDVLIREKR